MRCTDTFLSPCICRCSTYHSVYYWDWSIDETWMRTEWYMEKKTVKYSETILPHCHSVQHKSHTKWPRIEAGNPLSQGGDKLPETRQGFKARLIHLKSHLTANNRTTSQVPDIRNCLRSPQLLKYSNNLSTIMQREGSTNLPQKFAIKIIYV
jgi:hypothetical protein